MTPTLTNSKRTVRQLLSERFRCPEEFIAQFSLSGPLSLESGFFQLGPEIICYGQCSSGTPVRSLRGPLHDACEDERINKSCIELPIDAVQIIDNLYREQYIANGADGARSISGEGLVRNLYYRTRPLMPVAIRRHLQRLYLRGWQNIPFPKWPVDRTVESIFEHLLALSMKSQNVSRVPFIWFWPKGHRSCTIVTHDVETTVGREFCGQLMDINDSFGIKSSFQVVPEERYAVSPEYLDSIRGRGFEINVQDLNHDGHLFVDRAEFLRRAERINSYAREWGALGFRAAVLYRNTDWYNKLEFLYDMSIPNVAHLDPQRGGCCTILPFFVGKMVELPVTVIQDYSLFHILNEYSTSLWRRQISLIQEKHGLVNVIIHPDYLNDGAVGVYLELLRHLWELRATGKTWIALPRDVAEWWRLRDELTIVRAGDSWKIEGKGCEDAQIAYATLVDGNLQYEVAGPTQSCSAG